MRSQMSHVFSQVPQVEIPRSSFDRSHNIKTTFDAGYLVPFYVDEGLPGDTFSMYGVNVFARLATPIVPVMDNLYLDYFFFAVPNRILWTNWEKFNGAQDNPGDSTSYALPYINAPASTGWAVGTIGDYFGIPTGKTGFHVSALPFRAYNMIFNEWFRDQNLQNSVAFNTGDGPDASTDYTLKRRGKRHDYFTSALPWPQKGTAVSVPLGTSAPVVTTGVPPTFNSASVPAGNGALTYSQTTVDHLVTNVSLSTGGNTQIYFGSTTGLETDLSSATAATINSLRQAFQIQRMYERDARGGTRYTEILRSHFGVISPDARLQRPEDLGGGSIPIKVNPIAQTSATNVSGSTTPIGSLAAMGVASHAGNGWSKSFTEHMTLIGLCSVRADLNYQQGLNRMWSRSSRLDFYWPALSHLGEQSVLNKEIYLQGTSADTDVFGYQERYAEYRYKPNQITGQFRSTYSTPLDMWHLAQNFTSLPTLGDTFISDNPPLSRVLAVGASADGQQLLMDARINMKCARPMPVYSVPGMIDRF